MVGGDCCEDRNHRQLDISTGKPLGRPFQAIGIQPICHLQVQRDICPDLSNQHAIHIRPIPEREHSGPDKYGG